MPDPLCPHCRMEPVNRPGQWRSLCASHEFGTEASWRADERRETYRACHEDPDEADDDDESLA